MNFARGQEIAARPEDLVLVHGAGSLTLPAKVGLPLCFSPEVESDARIWCQAE